MGPSVWVASPERRRQRPSGDRNRDALAGPVCCAGPVSAPTEDEFRALARSAPWLFTTLHFTHRRGDGRGATEAWLSRPGRLWVRLADGREHVQLSTPWNNGRIIRDGREFEDVRPWAQQFNPTWLPDGLVAERPVDPRLDADDPLWGSYDWVAMLDPEELSHHTLITDLAIASREGRETWWAEVAADDGYQPRCGCCPCSGAPPPSATRAEQAVRPGSGTIPTSNIRGHG